MRDLIDLVGKLGPVAIAAAVFATNARQTAWQNQVAARSAALEDQKLRLALLEQRREAIEDLRSAILAIEVDGSNVGAKVADLSAVLRKASLVFPADDRAEIVKLMQSVIQFNMDVNMSKQAVRLRSDSDGALLRHGQSKILFLMNVLNTLVDRLTESTRVEPVPRLHPPKSIWLRVAGLANQALRSIKNRRGNRE